jgi:glycosyltransferase involved in cell wall biosynthesis
VILNVHDTFPELFATKFGRAAGHPLVRIARLEERMSAALATRLITVTDEARRCLSARGVGVGHTEVVMNSPDEGVFGPPREPVELPGEGPIRVLYHGGLAPRYGVATLIKAIGRLASTDPRVELRICGFGEERDSLAALAEQVAPGRVCIPTDPVPFALIPDELRAAHIGVVPTLHDAFTELLLPVKLMEYVHMGLPVVSSRLPGICSYFSDDALLTYAPGDSASLAAAISAVCSDPVGARERSRSASRRQQDLAWDRQRERYLALVDELALSGSRRGGPAAPHAGGASIRRSYRS